MSKHYDARPSELLGIEDAYTSYCFDEACIYIQTKLENKETPVFKKEQKISGDKHYKCVSEFYDDILSKKG